jgi:GNAT superfamily N-acetyltransferase
VASIAELQTAAWNDAYRDLVPAEYLDRMTVATRTERWGNRIRLRERTILLAERDGRLEGVVSYRLASHPGLFEGLELTSLYVAADIRSSGIGSRLLEFALANQPALLWVFRDNLRAIEFYRRHRFDLDGTESLDEDTGLALTRMSRGGEIP